MPFRGDNKVSNAKRCGINRKKMEGRWSSTRFIPLNDPDPIPICVNLSKIAKLRHAIPRIISIITENELETRFMHSLVEISYRFKIEYHRRRARNEQIQHLIHNISTQVHFHGPSQPSEHCLFSLSFPIIREGEPTCRTVHGYLSVGRQTQRAAYCL